jgi:hypothetical protein
LGGSPENYPVKNKFKIMIDLNQGFGHTVNTMSNANGLLVLDKPHQISAFQRLALLNGLKLEIKGLRMSRKGSSCFAMIKQRFGLKGTKEKVLREYEELLRDAGILQRPSAGQGKTANS